MRLLADSCVPGPTVRALRDLGFEVEWTAEWPRDPGDDAILAVARDSGRVLITRDKDFGELIFGRQRPHGGVIRIAADLPFAIRDRPWSRR